MRQRIVALLFLVACRPSAHESRGLLASMDPKKRQDGATALQHFYGKDPASVGDHGEAYWATRLARVRGLPASAALGILENPQGAGGEAGGGGATEGYRLDDFWVATLHRSTRGDDTIFGYTPPRRNVIHVDVERPELFTGTWTTYFVNGAVYESLALERGVAQRDRVFHDNGRLRYERVYIDGKLDGTVVSHDANGVPEWERSYAKGELVGIEKTFYPNGQLSQETHFAAGKIDGPLRNFSESGRVTSCIEYRAGVRQDGECAE